MNFAYLFLLVSVSFSRAMPPPRPRACTKILPSAIWWISESAPDYNHTGSRFHVDHSTYPGNNAISVVTFTNIPPGATGCMLAMEIPILVQEGIIAGGEATQLDVYTIVPDNPTNLSWNHQNFTRLTKVAQTIPFPTGNTTAPFQTVLCADACKSAMSFLFETSQWEINNQMAGRVGFANEVTLKHAQGVDTGNVGFYMEYDC